MKMFIFVTLIKSSYNCKTYSINLILAIILIHTHRLQKMLDLVINFYFYLIINKVVFSISNKLA